MNTPNVLIQEVEESYFSCFIQLLISAATHDYSLNQPTEAKGANLYCINFCHGSFGPFKKSFKDYATYISVLESSKISLPFNLLR